MKNPVHQRILELRQKLLTWNYQYYILHQPSVSDDVYDLSLKELFNLELQNPQYFDPLSPTCKVGHPVISKKFQKTIHQTPMLSLANAFSAADLQHFVNNCQKHFNQPVEYVLEPKMDGSSISLIYENHQLKKAISRGDGKIGEDITNNVKTIRNIPLKILNGPANFEVRGEIFMAKKDFDIFNQTLIAEQKKPFANPRNATAGTLRLQNNQEVMKKPLQAVFFQIIDAEQKFQITNQIAVLHHLKQWGFAVPQLIGNQAYVDFEQLWIQIEQFGRTKNNLAYPCDGLVLKVNNLMLHDEIGYTTKFPKWAIAYKFPSNYQVTQLLNIFGTVGRTGKITYVAKLKPVQINQTTVENATLHNADYILSKDIRLNDYVGIYKAGEIIPKIIAPELALRPNNTQVWSPLIYCPSCWSILHWTSNHVDQYCYEDRCLEKIYAQITHWCSRQAMNIEGLSEAIIIKLYKLKIIQDVADLYALEQHEKTIKAADIQIKDKLFNNLVNAITQSKNNSLEQLLFALGIPNVGQKIARDLAAHFTHLENFFTLTQEQLLALPTIGPIIAQSLIQWFANPKNQNLIQKLKIYQLNFQYLKPQANSVMIDGILSKKKIVITGTFPINRQQLLVKLTQKFLVINQNSVSKKTDYLIAGENPGTKLEKAKALNIPILFWKDLQNLIDYEN